PTELTYYFAQHMLEHGRPSAILNVASLAAFVSVPYFSVYSGTKSYLRDFSETLGYELAKSNIHISCLCPGGTETEFFDHSGQEIKRLGKKTMMSSEEVVSIALEGLKKRRRIIIPGCMNRLSAF